MKRVLIVGGPGAGKTVLSQKLAALTGLPIYHLDDLVPSFGDAGVIAELETKLDAIQKTESWIVDGCYYSKQRRFSASDTVIFMDPGGLKQIWRVFCRQMINAPSTPRNGGRRIPQWATICFVLTKTKTLRGEVLKLFQSAVGKFDTYRLCSIAETEQFLKRVQSDLRA